MMTNAASPGGNAAQFSNLEGKDEREDDSEHSTASLSSSSGDAVENEGWANEYDPICRSSSSGSNSEARSVNKAKLTASSSFEDDSFKEFMERVQRTAAQNNNNGNKELRNSPQRHKAMRETYWESFPPLPEYARYQVCKYHRVMSRGHPLSPERERRVRSIPPNVFQENQSAPTPCTVYCQDLSCSSDLTDMSSCNNGTGEPDYYVPLKFGSSLQEAEDEGEADEAPGLAAVSHSSHSTSTISTLSPTSCKENCRHRSLYPPINQLPPPPIPVSVQGRPFPCPPPNQRREEHRQPAQPPQREASNQTMVEISPGVKEPLRRTQETIDAVRNDFYVPVACLACSRDLFCIADSKYVICPCCKVFNPVEADGSLSLDGNPIMQRGIGLGFTCETLFDVQAEILDERRRRGLR